MPRISLQYFSSYVLAARAGNKRRTCYSRTLSAVAAHEKHRRRWLNEALRNYSRSDKEEEKENGGKIDDLLGEFKR